MIEPLSKKDICECECKNYLEPRVKVVEVGRVKEVVQALKEEFVEHGEYNWKEIMRAVDEWFGCLSE